MRQEMNLPQNISAGRRLGVTLVVGMGTILSTVTASMINVSLPTMADDFGVDITTVQWVVLGFFAAVSSLHLTMGRLADLLGRKRVYLSGYVIFGAASLAAALSPGIWWLVGARLAQAVGASILQANATAILTLVYPARQRGRAMGYFMLIGSAGLSVGPLIGGLILSVGSWPTLFLMLLPWVILAFLAGLFVLPYMPPVRKERFDAVGGVLLVLWVGPAVFGLNQGFRAGWASPVVLASLAAVCLFLSLFVFWQRRARHPVVPPSLLRSFEFRNALAVGYLGYVALSSVMLLGPFVIQKIMGVPIVQVGLLMAVYPAVSAVASVLAGRVTDRLGPRFPRTAGAVVMGFGFAALGLLSPSAGFAHAVSALVLVGIGTAFWAAPNYSAIMGSVPRDRMGVAGGFTAASRTFGWATGQALWGGIFALAVFAKSDAAEALQAPLNIQAGGFRLTFLLAAGAAMLVALLSARKQPFQSRS